MTTATLTIPTHEQTALRRLGEVGRIRKEEWTDGGSSVEHVQRSIDAAMAGDYGFFDRTASDLAYMLEMTPAGVPNVGVQHRIVNWSKHTLPAECDALIPTFKIGWQSYSPGGVKSARLTPVADVVNWLLENPGGAIRLGDCFLGYDKSYDGDQRDKGYYFADETEEGVPTLWADKWEWEHIPFLRGYFGELRDAMLAAGLDPDKVAFVGMDWEKTKTRRHPEPENWMPWSIRKVPGMIEACLDDPRWGPDIGDYLPGPVTPQLVISGDTKTNAVLLALTARLTERWIAYQNMVLDVIAESFPFARTKFQNYDTCESGFAITDPEQGESQYLSFRRSDDVAAYVVGGGGRVGRSNRRIYSHGLNHIGIYSHSAGANLTWENTPWRHFVVDCLGVASTWIASALNASYFVRWLDPARYSEVPTEGYTRHAAYWRETLLLALAAGRESGVLLWADSNANDGRDASFLEAQRLAALSDQVYGGCLGEFRFRACPSPDGWYAVYEVDTGSEVISRVVWDRDAIKTDMRGGRLLLLQSETRQAWDFPGQIIMDGPKPLGWGSPELDTGVWLRGN